MPSIRTGTGADHEARLVTLSNGHLTAVLTDLGARLLELHVPDRDGRTVDVVLGRPDLTTASADPAYMGATAGRYANRIRRGRFHLHGTDHQVTVNEGENHLHGGRRGFDQHGWTTELHPDDEGVTFSRVSVDGEEGFPGRLVAETRYRLDGSALEIAMTATTDRPTLANIVHHSYFNLGGHDSGDVLDHVAQLHAGHYTPVDDELLPTGEILAVAGTPFDFRTPTRLGEHHAEVHNTGAGRPTGSAGGFDHNWVLAGTGTRVVAVVADPRSGRRVTLSTNQPGLQLYTGGYLQDVTAKAPLSHYDAFAGFTLETQTFPDAANVAHFPSAVLEPGTTYRNTMRLEFAAD
ncbi:aldose 1-epimerase [Jatrophihabitans endophyticus]|uniref:Aldose 1-epimerase n=1 Tax=Jatrophihabitans endophyticus TaxID=1206085 RepID=A0A1M5CU12_9ACTN|nr:aldose epimerase family protein [Jatrophihabitans endophyticus]SHF58248.1 aldose 1-epimerase [Jatrophihabitans endophyticus]